MFKSRSIAYRNPTGAVTQGSSVQFRILTPVKTDCTEVYLKVYSDNDAEEYSLTLGRGEKTGGGTWWSCKLMPEKCGLYFYNFELVIDGKRTSLGKGPGQSDVLGGEDRWQLTVYSSRLETPDWLKGGVMYQIFPDRFFNSGAQKQNVPQDRVMHAGWEEEPVWRPDEAGIVRNNDYYGGDLLGITEKLPYLKQLGVTCIYLNPVCEAHENHRYNTADYSKIDPLLGSEADFTELCKSAREVGIRIITDGVFNHTGSDSVYFNKSGRYATNGAYNSVESEYYPWYRFSNWPDAYDCWWGFQTLPDVNTLEPSYDKYINGEDGIIRSWLRKGGSGWRLDVVDELPDEFLDKLCTAAKTENPEAVVIGEVWEDASNKIAYGKRRRYLLGGQLDSVMNYPFRNAVLGYLVGGDIEYFFETVLSVLENYPKPCIDMLMNHIGTHDTERALTVLAGEGLGGNDREWQSHEKLTSERRQKGIKLLKLASLIQYTLPGVPCIYYGDEAGLEGYKDPFNRRTYPWGKEDSELVEWYSMLGRLRRSLPLLKDAEFRRVRCGNLLCFERYKREGGSENGILVAVNRGDKSEDVFLSGEIRQPLFGTPVSDGGELAAFGFSVMKYQRL